MKWQCALLQRWLPEYPDGDLHRWGKWLLKTHVAQCSACRRELAELNEVIGVIKSSPDRELSPEFWSDFSREMHLKLVQAVKKPEPVPVSRRWSRLPYLVGAPALAVLLLYVAVHLSGLGNLTPNQARVTGRIQPKVALKAVTPPVPAPPAAVTAAPNGDFEQFIPVALGERAASSVDDEVDISDWDLDSEVAGMTDHEKETFLKRLDQHKKDGSCLEKCSFSSWA